MAVRAGALVVGLRSADQQWLELIGFESVEHETPVSASSRFMVGSIAKQFLGAAVAAAVKQGLVAFSTRAEEYLPSLRLSDITLEHLVNHTSGLRETETLFALAGLREHDFVSPEDHFEALALQVAPMSPPGKHFSYANINYLVAAEMLRVETGETLNDLVTALIFDSAGLSSTCFVERPDVVLARRCDSYRLDKNVVRRALTTMPTAGPSGLWSTPSDLLAWASIRRLALKTAPTLMLERSQAQALCAWPDTLTGRYMAGIVEGHTNDGLIIGHAGDDQGYSAQLLTIGDVHLVALSSIAEIRAADLISGLWQSEPFHRAVRSGDHDAAQSLAAAALEQHIAVGNIDPLERRHKGTRVRAPSGFSGSYECDEALAPITLETDGSDLIMMRGAQRDVLSPSGHGCWNGPGYALRLDVRSPGVVEVELSRSGVLRFIRS